MKTKAIMLAISFVTLAIFAQGWRNGQLLNTPNPTAQNCANAGCHGGQAPETFLDLIMISGNNQTFTPGNNALIVRPVVATDTIGGGSSGDSTLRCWGYTANFTTCTGQPLPISVSMHSCSGGMPLKYQSNGLWYVEATENPILQWQTLPGQPSNVRYLTNYCIIAFTVSGSYADSIKMNFGVVLSNCDSLRTGDSTIFYSSKLGAALPLHHEVHEHPNTLPFQGVNDRDYWEVINLHGVVILSGKGGQELSLQPGLYYMRIEDYKTKQAKAKPIIIR